MKRKIIYLFIFINLFFLLKTGVLAVTPTATPSPTHCRDVCTNNGYTGTFFDICALPETKVNNYWCGPADDPTIANLCYYNVSQFNSGCPTGQVCYCYYRTACGENNNQCQAYCTNTGCNPPTPTPTRTPTPTPTRTPTPTPTPTLASNERCRLSARIEGSKFIIDVTQNPKYNNNSYCYYSSMDVNIVTPNNETFSCKAEGFSIDNRTRSCSVDLEGKTILPGVYTIKSFYGGHSDNCPNQACCDEGYNCQTTLQYYSIPTPTLTPTPTRTPTPGVTPTILTSNTLIIHFVSQLPVVTLTPAPTHTPTPTPTPHPCASACQGYDKMTCNLPLAQATPGWPNWQTRNYMCGPSTSNDKTSCYYGIVEKSDPDCSRINSNYICRCFRKDANCGGDATQCQENCTANGCNIPTLTPTATPTRTLTPTATPTRTPTSPPRPTSTPPPAGGITLRINFFGVKKEPDNPNGLDYKNQLVKVTLKKKDGEKVYEKMITFRARTAANNIFYYENTNDLITPNIPTGTYNLFLKGPKHLQVKIRDLNITGETKLFDLAGTENSLPGGDLPLPANNYQQDGKVNALDYAFLINNFNKREADVLKVGDLNLDGIINTGDTSVLATTLGEKLDEDGN